MKDIEFFDKKVRSLAYELGCPGKYTGREVKALTQEKEDMKKAKAFMLTNPSEEFIRKEIARLESFITAKLLEFDDNWRDKLDKIPKPAASKIRKEFEEQYGIPKKRLQIKFMRFLLD